MAQKITKGINDLTQEAYQVIEDISVEQAKTLYEHDEYVFIDVREADERRKSGVIPRAFPCPRGMLEFLIDPKCKAHNKVFAQNKTYVFYCASGLRSLYAAKQAFDMGLHPVKNLAGGFAAWLQSEAAIAKE